MRDDEGSRPANGNAVAAVRHAEGSGDCGEGDYLMEGDAVEHWKFGVGRVVTGQVVMPEGGTRVEVDFALHERMWLVCEFARLVRLHETRTEAPDPWSFFFGEVWSKLKVGDLGYIYGVSFFEVLAVSESSPATWIEVRQRDGRIMRLLERHAGVVDSRDLMTWPSAHVGVLCTEVNLFARRTTLSSWKRSANAPLKRHRIQLRLDFGELLGPLVESLPLPWTCEPVLCGPVDLQASSDDMAGRGRFNGGTSRGMPTAYAPRAVVGCMPPFRRLRGVLADVVVAAERLGESMRAELCAAGTALPEQGAWVIELFSPQPAANAGDQALGRRVAMRERAIKAIQRLRAISHANGRWWPAPESLELICDAKGCFAARMRFARSYRPADPSRLEWPAPAHSRKNSSRCDFA